MQHFDYVIMWCGSCCVFRTGNDYMLLSGTCKPTGTCWSGRGSSCWWKRKSRWQWKQAAPLYLRASSTSSWTWGTWWAKSAVRYRSSTVFLLKSTHIVATLVHIHFGGSDTKTDVINFVLLSSADELHKELLDEASFPHRTASSEPRNQLQNSMGQQSGRLHHSEGSRPLPHQAGKRLPPAGLKNTILTQYWKGTTAVITRHFNQSFSGGVHTLHEAFRVTLMNLPFFFYMMSYCVFNGFLGYFPEFLSHL